MGARRNGRTIRDWQVHVHVTVSQGLLFPIGGTLPDLPIYNHGYMERNAAILAVHDAMVFTEQKKKIADLPFSKSDSHRWANSEVALFVPAFLLAICCALKSVQGAYKGTIIKGPQNRNSSN